MHVEEELTRQVSKATITSSARPMMPSRPLASVGAASSFTSRLTAFADGSRLAAHRQPRSLVRQSGRSLDGDLLVAPREVQRHQFPSFVVVRTWLEMTIAGCAPSVPRSLSTREQVGPDAREEGARTMVCPVDGASSEQLCGPKTSPTAESFSPSIREWKHRCRRIAARGLNQARPRFCSVSRLRTASRPSVTA